MIVSFNKDSLIAWGITIFLIITGSVLSCLLYNNINRVDSRWDTNLETGELWLSPNNSNIFKLEKVEGLAGYITSVDAKGDNINLNIKIGENEEINLNLMKQDLNDKMFNYINVQNNGETQIQFDPSKLLNRNDLNLIKERKLFIDDFIKKLEVNATIQVYLKYLNYNSKDYTIKEIGIIDFTV